VATPTTAEPPPRAEPVPRLTPQERFEQKREARRPREFQFEWWEPKAPITPGRERGRVRVSPEGEPIEVPAPREFDPVAAAGREFVQFTERWDSLNDSLSGLPPDPVVDADERMMAGSLMPQTGRQEDILDAYFTLFNTYKNLEEFIKQYKDFDPEGIEQLNREVAPGVRNSPTAIASSGTLNPLRALLRSLEEINKAHPDNYTQFLASDAGFAELFNNAVMMMMTPPKSEWSLLTLGESAGEAIDKNMADVPFLKPAIVNTVEIAGDPILIGSLVVFPGAGLAAKARLGAEVAVGMGVGEETAEAVGLPGIVGALPGALLGPGISGFTRASMRAAVRKARHWPVRGEPATEILIQGGQLPVDLGELGATVGERRIFYRGMSTNQEAAVGEGAFLTASAKDAEVYAGVNVRAHGGKPVIQVFTSEEGAVLPMPAEESLAGARGGVRVANPEGVRLLQPGELPYPQMAGGATGPTIEGFRTKIRAHIERPEARDFLRLIAGKVADWVPMGRRVQEIVNRLALADEPALKAAFGWHFQQAEDTAARFMTMAPFRGAKVPFIENEVGQIWMPKVAGAGRRTVGNLFREGEGEWIAVGDVFESVMRGEKTYLGRLTQEQVDWVARARVAMEPHISFAEQATGMSIRKKDVWWPRVAVDPVRKLWNVSPGTRRGKPPMLHKRLFEEQQEAIQQYGIKYRPGVLNQMDGAIESAQKLTRDSLMARYLREEGILRAAGEHGPRLTETYGTDLGSQVIGVMNKEHFQAIETIIGPGTRNPVIAVPQKINGIARLMLTGSLDTGWGAIQLLTLAASPAGPKGWAEAMARGFYNALVEPKQFYRWMANSKAAQQYALYGGDLGMTSELMEAARIGGLGLPRAPVVSPIIDVATFPVRSFINRLQVGFDSSLAYGRTLAFDSFAEVATKPGLMAKAAGARPLSGAALHEEMFRLARFTDTLIGQPKLGGVISSRQHQIESAYVWFATRYTRSFLGTMSYMLGKGYTPAQARATMAKLMLGGMSIMSGLIAAHGAATGKSEDEVFEDIKTSLNPTSGKKFMSMKMGKDWYGIGGVYRSGIALFGGLANKDNWDFENWEQALWDNPIVRQWRSRTAPLTSTFMDFLEGEDFMGYSVNFWEFVDDPRKLADYALDKFAPITLDALLQEGDHMRKGTRFLAEFFGLRTSPETAFEALEPVMNQVSQYSFGVPWEGLENNAPAQDFVRNHPNVVAVTEGRVRPIREREREKFWRKYREGRDRIAGTHAETRQSVEDSYVSGRMTGSDYREQYGEAQSAEYFEIRGFREGLGVDFEDQGEAPAGTVNAALDAYYNIDLDDYRDKETRVPDWEAFFADRDASLAQVPEEFQPLVEQWLTRRETEVRRHMRTRFEDVVEPSGYFRMREEVAVTLGVSLDDLESQLVQALQKDERRASPADVARLVDQVLNGSLKQTFGEDAPSISKLRQIMREASPALDAELFRQGFVTTVRSEAAQEQLKRYQQMWRDMGYFEAPLASDVKERLRREAEER
jgi:hypothetical protein